MVEKVVLINPSDLVHEEGKVASDSLPTLTIKLQPLHMTSGFHRKTDA